MDKERTKYHRALDLKEKPAKHPVVEKYNIVNGSKYKTAKVIARKLKKDYL